MKINNNQRLSFTKEHQHLVCLKTVYCKRSIFGLLTAKDHCRHFEFACQREKDTCIQLMNPCQPSRRRSISQGREGYQFAFLEIGSAINLESLQWKVS